MSGTSLYLFKVKYPKKQTKNLFLIGKAVYYDSCLRA